MKYGPIQPQDVVMCWRDASLCPSVTEGLTLSTKRGNHAPAGWGMALPRQGNERRMERQKTFARLIHDEPS